MPRMQFTVLAFNVEWYDTNAQMVRKYRLNCYNDETLELINEVTKQNFLKRIHYPSVQPTDLYIGATINVFSRKLQIVEYADLGTQKVLEAATSRAVGVMGLSAPHALGHVLDALMSKFRITAAKTVFADDVNLSGVPTGTALCVEAVSHGTDGPDALAATLDQLAQDGLISTFAPVATSADESTQLSIELFQKDVHNSAVNESGCTLCLVKPHLVKQCVFGPLMEDMAAAGFEIKCAEMFVLDLASATEFYDVYKGVQTEYTDAVAQLIKAPLFALQVVAPEGDPDAVVEAFREFCGPTDVEIARHLRPNSLRAKYGQSRVMNAVHCTDLPEDGLLECKFFFNTLAGRPVQMVY